LVEETKDRLEHREMRDMVFVIPGSPFSQQSLYAYWFSISSSLVHTLIIDCSSAIKLNRPSRYDWSISNS